VEDEHGAPVAGAAVRALLPSPTGSRLDFLRILRELPEPPVASEETRSSADGTFRLSHLPPGTYTLVATKPPLGWGVGRDVGVPPRAAAPPVRPVLPQGFRVEGRVVRKDGGSPKAVPVVAFREPQIEHLDMSMPDKQCTATDDEGRFALDG